MTSANDANRARPRNHASGGRFLLLEAISSAVLLLSIGALGWILTVAYQPRWLRLASTELEVIIVIAIFIAALLLVSLVALLHTRH